MPAGTAGGAEMADALALGISRKSQSAVIADIILTRLGNSLNCGGVTDEDYPGTFGSRSKIKEVVAWLRTEKFN
jgi:hypothetical protein